MTRQRWLQVGSIILGIALGTWALTRYVAPSEGTAIGNRLADFRVARLPQGDSLGLRSGYEGHVTLINLWATYCGPCIKEMPSIERLYQAYKGRGFRVAAVSLDDTPPAPVLEFASKLGVTFDIFQDRSNLSLQTYQGVGLPFSILIDAKGKVRYVALGREEWDSPANMARIDSLLGASQ